MTRGRWNLFILVVALAGVAWIAVNRLPAVGSAAAGALPAAPAVGHPAPDFQLVDTAGNPFALSELRGTPASQPPGAG